MPSVARPSTDGSRGTAGAGGTAAGTSVTTAPGASSSCGGRSWRALTRAPQGHRQPHEEHEHRPASVEQAVAILLQQERQATDEEDTAGDPGQRVIDAAHEDQPQAEVQQEADATDDRQQHERDAEPQGVDPEARREEGGDAAEDAIGRWCAGGGPAGGAGAGAGSSEGGARSTAPTVRIAPRRRHRGHPWSHPDPTGTAEGPSRGPPRMPTTPRPCDDAEMARLIDALRTPRGSDRVIAGVASGWADRWGVEPTVVRAAVGLLTLAGGLGAVLYGLAAVTSTASLARAPTARRRRRTPAPRAGHRVRHRSHPRRRRAPSGSGRATA